MQRQELRVVFPIASNTAFVDTCRTAVLWTRPRRERARFEARCLRDMYSGFAVPTKLRQPQLCHRTRFSGTAARCLRLYAVLFLFRGVRSLHRYRKPSNICTVYLGSFLALRATREPIEETSLAFNERERPEV